MKSAILLCLTATLFVSACCTKVECINIHGFPITLKGFKKSEVDSIYITGYVRGSAFSQVGREEKLDSIMWKGDPDTTVFFLDYVDRGRQKSVVYTGQHLTDEYDWKLYIPALNRTVFITNYGYQTHKCNRCTFKKADKVSSLSTLTVDGVVNKATEDVTVYP